MNKFLEKCLCNLPKSLEELRSNFVPHFQKFETSFFYSAQMKIIAIPLTEGQGLNLKRGLKANRGTKILLKSGSLAGPHKNFISDRDFVA